MSLEATATATNWLRYFGGVGLWLLVVLAFWWFIRKVVNYNQEGGENPDDRK